MLPTPPFSSSLQWRQMLWGRGSEFLPRRCSQLQYLRLSSLPGTTIYLITRKNDPGTACL
jgi:hypothetical protein